MWRVKTWISRDFALTSAWQYVRDAARRRTVIQQSQNYPHAATCYETRQHGWGYQSSPVNSGQLCEHLHRRTWGSFYIKLTYPCGLKYMRIVILLIDCIMLVGLTIYLNIYDIYLVFWFCKNVTFWLICTNFKQFTVKTLIQQIHDIIILKKVLSADMTFLLLYNILG